MASLFLGSGTVLVFELNPGLYKIFGGGIIPGVVVSLVLTVGISLLQLAGRKAAASGAA
jgi:hypothetical protein